MAAQNLKIHLVDELLVGPEYKTDVWASDAAIDGIFGFPDRERFLKKLKHYARVGFWEFESGPIKYEWDGVYRVSHTTRSLFRLVGFYEERKASFIAIDTFLKGGQKLKAPQRARITEIGKIRRHRTWKKAQP